MGDSRKGIGVCGSSAGAASLARKLESMGWAVASCGRNGGGIGTYGGFREARAALGPAARIFAFSSYDRQLEEARVIAPFIEKGDIVFEANAFPLAVAESVRYEYATRGAAWIPIKIAAGPETDSASMSVLACGEGMDGESRSLLSSLSSKRIDGKPCYAELPDPRSIAVARSSYRSLIDVLLQGFADAYRILSGLLKMSPFEARMVFAEWAGTELDSPILDGMRDVLGTMDDSGSAALDLVLDTVKLDSGDLGAIGLSLALGRTPPLSSAAFSARVVSGFRDERLGASVALGGPSSVLPRGREFLPDLRDSLVASFGIAFAQGLACLGGAGGNLKAGETASAWAGASLLQGPLMDVAAGMLSAQDSPRILLLEPEFQRMLNACQAGLRRTVAAIAEAGIPAPALSSALNLYDSFRSERLSSNLVAAGLDYFFGVGFERTDRPRSELYHRDWRGDGSLSPLPRDLPD